MAHKVFSIIEINSGIVETPNTFVVDESKGLENEKQVKQYAKLAFKECIEKHANPNEEQTFNDYLDSGYYAYGDFEVYFFES